MFYYLFTACVTDQTTVRMGDHVTFVYGVTANGSGQDLKGICYIFDISIKLLLVDIDDHDQGK